MAGLIGTLYVEELNATTRGRFAWAGAGAIMLALGVVATVATQDTWLDGYGIIAYFLVPLAFIPLSAGAIASPRANRFVESVFTAPVRRRDWILAKILTLFTIALAYYAALLPMLLVYTHHVGLPPLLRSFLFWTPGILVASVAVGTLVGVLFIGRSVAAPVGAGVGVLLAYASLVPLQEVMVAQANGSSRIGHFVLASPAVLFKNALGFTLLAGSVPAATASTWLSIVLVVVGAFALAMWIFLRAQGVETWEATRAQRWTIGIAMLALIVAPMLLADTDYDKSAPPPNRAPAIRALFARANGNLALAHPDGRPAGRCCGTILNRDDWPMGTGEPSQWILTVLLPVDTSQPIADVQVRVAGDFGLHVSVDPEAVARATSHPERRAYGTDAGPITADGRRITEGWTIAVPVTLEPTSPWDIGGNRYPLVAEASYRVPGENAPRTLTARGAIEAQVPNAIYEMGGASSIIPFFCFGAALLRWRRTR